MRSSLSRAFSGGVFVVAHASLNCAKATMVGAVEFDAECVGNRLPTLAGTTLAFTFGDIARSPFWQAGRQPTTLAGGVLGLPTALYARRVISPGAQRARKRT